MKPNSFLLIIVPIVAVLSIFVMIFATVYFSTSRDAIAASPSRILVEVSENIEGHNYKKVVFPDGAECYSRSASIYCDFTKKRY